MTRIPFITAWLRANAPDGMLLQVYSPRVARLIEHAERGYQLAPEGAALLRATAYAAQKTLYLRDDEGYTVEVWPQESGTITIANAGYGNDHGRLVLSDSNARKLHAYLTTLLFPKSTKPGA